MPNGAQTTSHAAPASQTGQTGSRSRGGGTPATSAVISHELAAAS